MQIIKKKHLHRGKANVVERLCMYSIAEVSVCACVCLCISVRANFGYKSPLLPPVAQMLKQLPRKSAVSER